LSDASARSVALALALCPLLALAGCDGGSDEATTAAVTTTTPEEQEADKPPERRRETRDPLPDGPKEWNHYVNDRGGFALLVPPGWNPKTEGPQTLVRSYDQLVAFTVAADRSAEGLETELEDYATATADDLRGFRGGFEPRGMRPIDHRYNGVQVYGEGRSREGVDQRASVTVLRRDKLTTITVVLAASARPAARESVRLARRSIATLRTRPPRRGGGT
jgi:hypothetical protein